MDSRSKRPSHRQQYTVFTSGSRAYVFSGPSYRGLDETFVIDSVYASGDRDADEMDRAVGRVSDYVSVQRSTHETWTAENDEEPNWPDVKIEKLVNGYKFSNFNAITPDKVAMILAAIV